MNTRVTHSAPEPVFAEPWHAQVFAVTVALNEAGRFEWSDWAERFSQTLKMHGLDRELDGGDDYFHAWLETLEQLLIEQGAAEFDDIQQLRNAWEKAYLTTPHGQPVHLAASE
ncbi:nitrile hydratase accessory protein [Ruegeria denitrificans]|uniref:Nitrile hydratase accessory protein n=1 Tax=Ruegeria denitrificans TaxID=1715692 RepID=A0A0P1I5Q6_9RHOB|nr:nitrile hydratase accessory protein [Ruegeria denitrificans]CUJ91567.1 nitrile hydratase accessory protein [Ruegeria denitrificans]